LSITDRKKDLIVTAGGKNIAPQPIEAAIAESPYVDIAVVSGDKRKYLVALITLNIDAVREFAHGEGVAFSNDEDLYNHPAVHDLIERVISQKNERFARFETIKRFAIIPGTLSTADGGLTPTLKVRRKRIMERYADILEGLYRN
jgi:long-chain acyl-CoA synthetase